MILNKLKVISQVVGWVGFILLALQGALTSLDGQPAWAAPLLQWGGSTVPLVVNYQGYLRNAEGAPLSGSYDVTFKIYDDVIAGNVLYEETQTGVSVRNGYFSVLLGNNAPDNTLPPNLFISPDRFIGITVAPYAEMIPRQRFAAVPYALQAQQAQSLRAPDGNPINAVFVDNDGDVGIGTTNPEVPLEVRKAGATFDFAILKFGDAFGHAYLGAGSDGFGLADQNKRIRLGINQATGNVIVDQRLGIRTTNPRQALEVHGGFRFTPDTGACAGPFSNCFGDIYYRTSNDNSAGLIINSQTGADWADINLQTNGTSRLTIDSRGAVGVGTTDPQATLDVNGEFKIGSRKPIFLQRFYRLGDNIFHNTGISALEYNCGIAGLATFGGDIQEHGSGDIIQAYTYVAEDQWVIRADFRTHNNHENWHITLICIDTKMSDRKGF